MTGWDRARATHARAARWAVTAAKAVGAPPPAGVVNELARFWEAFAQVMRIELPDTGAIDTSVPVPALEAPTEQDLADMTDSLAGIEHGIADLDGFVGVVDASADALNLAYNRYWFVSENEDERQAAAAFDDARAHVSALREGIAYVRTVLTTQLGLYSAARAKVEHDLQWQQYIRETGGDPAAIPRAMKYRGRRTAA